MIITKYGYYKTLRKIWAKASQMLPAGYHFLPPQITFFLVFDCNLNCRMCNIHNSKTVRLSFDNFKVILKNIKHSYRFLPFLPVLWFSGGEIFMHPDLLKMLKLAKKMGFRFVLATNGTLIGQREIEFLKRHQPLEVRISIDGDEKTHDDCRGKKGSYAKAVQAAKDLRSAGIGVAISSIISPYNRSIGHLVALFKKMDINVYFQQLFFIKEKNKGMFSRQLGTFRKYVSDDFIFENYEKDFPKKNIDALWNEFSKHKDSENVKILGSYFKTKKELIRYYNSSASMIDSSRLTIISTSAQILPDGNICGTKNMPLFKKNSFATAWNSPRMRKYRNSILSLGKTPRVPPITWI